MTQWLDKSQKKLLRFFLMWRITLFVIGIAAASTLPYRPQSEFTTFVKFTEDTWVKNSVVFTPWANFDGVHYLLIARQGYDNEARFFPLYPLTIRFVNFFTGISPQWIHADFVLMIIGLVISNLVFAVALLLFYRLLRMDHSEKVAFWSSIFLMIFPTAFFFVSLYGESMFLLLSIGALFFARKKKWLAAALCAALASATRVVGIILLAVLVVEYFQQSEITFAGFRKNIFRELSKLHANILLLLLAPVGFVSFAFFNFTKWGRWNFFLEQQADLGNSRSVGSIVDPVRVLIRYLRILMTVSSHQYEWRTALTELLFFVLGLILFYFAWRKRIRPSYVVFSLGCFFFPVLSGTLSGLPRYILVIFPFFLLMGMVENKALRYAMIFLCSFFSAIFITLFVRGYYIA